MLIPSVAHTYFLLQEAEGITNLKVQVVEGIASVQVCMHQLLTIPRITNFNGCKNYYSEKVAAGKLIFSRIVELSI